MTEQQAEYGIQKSDIGELQAMSAVTWERNALVFNRIDDRVIEQLSGGLIKFTDGYQAYWGDFWQMLELSGYEWTDYVPESVAYNTAQNWRRMVKRFPVDVRLSHQTLKASHYIEANSKKITDEQAIQLLEVADQDGWTVQMVREGVKAIIGKEPPEPKPKPVICPHCERWMIEGQECWGCCYDQLYKQYNELVEQTQDDWK